MNVAGAGDDRSELELATMDIPPTGEGAGCANMTALLARDGKLNRGDVEGNAEEDEEVGEEEAAAAEEEEVEADPLDKKRLQCCLTCSPFSSG